MKVNIQFDTVEISGLQGQHAQALQADLQTELTHRINTYLSRTSLPNNKEIQIRQRVIKLNSAKDISYVAQTLLNKIDTIIQNEMQL